MPKVLKPLCQSFNLSWIPDHEPSRSAPCCSHTYLTCGRRRRKYLSRYTTNVPRAIFRTAKQKLLPRSESLSTPNERRFRRSRSGGSAENRRGLPLTGVLTRRPPFGVGDRRTNGGDNGRARARGEATGIIDFLVRGPRRRRRRRRIGGGGRLILLFAQGCQACRPMANHDDPLRT